MIDDIYYWLMQQRCKIGWHKWIYWYELSGEFCVYCSKDRVVQGRAPDTRSQDDD